MSARIDRHQSTHSITGTSRVNRSFLHSRYVMQDPCQLTSTLQYARTPVTFASQMLRACRVLTCALGVVVVVGRRDVEVRFE